MKLFYGNALFKISSMKDLSIVLTLIFCSAYYSCDKENHSVLKGCCENPSINESFGNAHVYIPNIFTPNGDGRNDELEIYGDSVQLIKNFEIRNKNGELVFHVEHYALHFDPTRWDGKYNNIVEEGLYSIIVELEAFDGTIGKFEGKVCNYPCGLTDEEEQFSTSNCQFPVQTSNGRYEPTIPSGETIECFN